MSEEARVAVYLAACGVAAVYVVGNFYLMLESVFAEPLVKRYYRRKVRPWIESRHEELMESHRRPATTSDEWAWRKLSGVAWSRAEREAWEAFGVRENGEYNRGRFFKVRIKEIFS